jgi:hypothetical protein
MRQLRTRRAALEVCTHPTLPLLDDINGRNGRNGRNGHFHTESGACTSAMQVISFDALYTVAEELLEDNHQCVLALLQFAVYTSATTLSADGTYTSTSS